MLAISFSEWLPSPWCCPVFPHGILSVLYLIILFLVWPFARLSTSSTFVCGKTEAGSWRPTVWLFLCVWLVEGLTACCSHNHTVSGIEVLLRHRELSEILGDICHYEGWTARSITLYVRKNGFIFRVGTSEPFLMCFFVCCWKKNMKCVTLKPPCILRESLFVK